MYRMTIGKICKYKISTYSVNKTWINHSNGQFTGSTNT